MAKEATIRDAERLIDKLKYERFTYLILITICIISIIGIGMYLAVLKNDYKSFLALCAPTGILTFCLSRVFKIWDDVMKVFFNLNRGNNE